MAKSGNRKSPTRARTQIVSVTPNPLDAWLSKHTNIRQLLERLNREMIAGSLSEEDVILLIRKWRETLPPQRGVVKYLRDFMQLTLDVGPLGGTLKKWTRRRANRTARRRL